MSTTPTVHCSCTPVADTECHPSSVVRFSDALLSVVAEALAVTSDQSLDDLPPLYDAVDLDAVDQLFDRQRIREGAETVILNFSYQQWNVFVRSDGHIRVCDASVTDAVGPVFEKER